MMKIVLLIQVLIVFLWSGCTKQVSIVGDPTMYLNQMDETLQEIRRQAQETFPTFIDKLSHADPRDRNFWVKYPFETDLESGFGYEHLWLGDISIQNGIYYGLVSNKPCYISYLEPGDRVSFNAAGISDWMYIENGAIIGGLSIKYLIQQIPRPDLEPGLREFYKNFVGEAPNSVK
jgi:uncharacterized protein YegJ (DUF2314 family)